MRKFEILLIVSLLITACNFKNDEPIKVGYLKITSHAPIVAADKYAVFKKYGLNVELEVYPNTPALVSALNDGKIDICFQVTPESLWKYENFKYYAYFLAKSSKEYPIDGLYSLNPNILDSLKGKTVGHFPGPTAKLMTQKFLFDITGLNVSDYNLKEVAPPLQLSMLERKDIDLLFTYEPMGALAIFRLGAKNVCPAPVESYIINPWMGGIGVFSEKFVTNRNKDAKKFIKAIVESNNILLEDINKKTETLVSLQAGLPSEVAKDIPLTELIFSLNNVENTKYATILENQLGLYRTLELTSCKNNNILFFDNK